MVGVRRRWGVTKEREDRWLRRRLFSEGSLCPGPKYAGSGCPCNLPGNAESTINVE